MSVFFAYFFSHFYFPIYFFLIFVFSFSFSCFFLFSSHFFLNFFSLFFSDFFFSDFFLIFFVSDFFADFLFSDKETQKVLLPPRAIYVSYDICTQVQDMDSPYAARLPLRPAANGGGGTFASSAKELTTPELIRPSPGNPSRQASSLLLLLLLFGEYIISDFDLDLAYLSIAFFNTVDKVIRLDKVIHLFFFFVRRHEVFIMIITAAPFFLFFSVLFCLLWLYL